MDTVPDGASLIRPTSCTDSVGRIRRLIALRLSDLQPALNPQAG
ncbi:hypothetical protein CKO_00452 [Citrobacter koseri ATCC BAA-895]|uniref:Uncharacterized protein n=1 Tax=Citrobacter koseri (strain ATCC BAA-895 / CDC 4225-83 / SGSC4696) TaxID=290338 RepID=A8ADP5_CITK8|nr:hypothetical protein CKO_00452 [Citrobacter koseri ATCC BAA-895]